MINPEHHPTIEPGHPRHRQEVLLPESIEGYADVPPAVNTRWEVGRDRHGKAFSAFLTLGDIDIRSPDILEQFELYYRGSFPDVRALADMFIDSLGWKATFDALQRTEPELSSFLQWNYSQIEERLHLIYDIIEIDGRIYLFDA